MHEILHFLSMIFALPSLSQGYLSHYTLKIVITLAPVLAS